MKFYINKSKIINLGRKTSCDCMLFNPGLYISCYCPGKRPWNSCRQVFAGLQTSAHS